MKLYTFISQTKNMHMKNLTMYVFLVFVIGSSINFYGQEENEENSFKQPVQELLFSDPVYLQEPKEFQQTLHAGHLENDDELSNSLAYEIEYGLVKGFQISAGYTYEHWNVENVPFDSGWLETGVLISLLNNSRQAAALSLEAEFPVNKPDPEDIETEDSPAYTPTLIYAFQISKTQLHLSAGTEFQEKEVNWFYNAAAVYGDGTFHPVIELNAISEEDFNWYAGAGLIVNADNGWELGAGLRHGINNSEWDGSLHLVYEFSFGSEEE